MASEQPNRRGKHRAEDNPDPDAQPATKATKKIFDSFLAGWPINDPDDPQEGGK